MRKILIFTVTAGNGHNSAAKQISEKFKQCEPNCDIKVVDVFKKYSNKLKTWLINDGYQLACKYMVETYNWIFNILKKQKAENRNKLAAQGTIIDETPEILREIYDYKPDLIYCTHFYPAIAITNLRKFMPIPAKVFTTTLDYDVSPFWECAIGVDYIFSTNDYVKGKLLTKGYRDEQVLSYGIGINPKFAVHIEKEDARKQLGLDPNLFTVVVMKASFFTISAERLLKEFEKSNSPIQVVFVNGNLKPEKKELDKRIKALKTSKNKYINCGFINNMEIYYSAADMVLAKAGGLTTTECLNKCVPAIIINKLPQQEIENMQFVVENGCSIPLDKSMDLGKTVNAVLENPAILDRLKENIKRTNKPNALDNIYNFMASFGSADYSNIPLIPKSNEKIKMHIRKILSECHKTETKEVTVFKHAVQKRKKLNKIATQAETKMLKVKAKAEAKQKKMIAKKPKKVVESKKNKVIK